MLKNYKDCLFNGEARFKSDKSYHHKVYTEVHNIALTSDDDKRLQTFNRFTTYPYGKNGFKMFESEMKVMKDFFC